MRMMLVLLAAASAACTTQRAYTGPALPAAERAIVHADPAVTAGLPVQLRLRQADGHDVSLHASAVELPPGPHSLLVDCHVLESGATSRFVVEADLEAGGSYRLVAQASTRNCEAVELLKQ